LRSAVRHNLLATTALAVLLAASPALAAPQLKYVVILTRHGVRSPTWTAERLDRYSAESWPDWGVPPGNLTAHGRALVRLMGGYYRDWLTRDHLLAKQGCSDESRVYIWADTDQRTIETGRAVAETLLPGCSVATHARSNDKVDPLFEGVGTPDARRLENSVRGRLGSDPQQLLLDHRDAFDTLSFVLEGPQAPTKERLFDPMAPLAVSVRDRSVDLEGPFATGSTLGEDLLLEYANGMQGKDLGWGRLTEDNLLKVLDLHEIYTELVRRTPYAARAKGSNLLNRILLSLQQAAAGRPVPGAIGHAGDKLLVLSGHDTNISNLSGMLDLSWKLPGYQPNDTPPGGALIFSLWQDAATHGLVVKTQYVAQTLRQMRDLSPLSDSAPPAHQDLFVRGCGRASLTTVGCSWRTFRKALQGAIDPAFTAVAGDALQMEH
jgi:4-phytase/acid phosphatase